MNAEQRILAWLERADFNGTGCWHSQDTIAKATGCCRRTVIRSITSLEADGRIRVQRFARGSRRPNVYRVANWNPQKRSGVLNVLSAIREARKAECHTKREARPSRAQATPVNPSLTASSWRTSRCGREKTKIRTCERCGRTIRLQGGRMAEPLRLPVDCDECARKDRIIRQYAENHSKLVEEVSSAHEVARAAGKEVTKLKGQLTRQANEHTENEQITALLEDWKRDHPKAQIPAGGRRWEVARKALRLMADDDAGPLVACLEALAGLRLAPYQQFEKRYATPGEKRTLRNDIEHALGDEKRIEACRRIARAVKASPAERLWWMYEQTAPVAEGYFRLAVDAMADKPGQGTPEDRRFMVDGIPTEVD